MYLYFEMPERFLPTVHFPRNWHEEETHSSKDDGVCYLCHFFRFTKSSVIHRSGAF